MYLKYCNVFLKQVQKSTQKSKSDSAIFRKTWLSSTATRSQIQPLSLTAPYHRHRAPRTHTKNRTLKAPTQKPTPNPLKKMVIKAFLTLWILRNSLCSPPLLDLMKPSLCMKVWSLNHYFLRLNISYRCFLIPNQHPEVRSLNHYFLKPSISCRYSLIPNQRIWNLSSAIRMGLNILVKTICHFSVRKKKR